MSRRLVLILATCAVSAACAHGATAPSNGNSTSSPPGGIPIDDAFTRPSWSAPTGADLPPDVDSLQPTAAGWDNGVLLAAQSIEPQILVSNDLHTWRHAPISGLQKLAYWPIAGFGPAAYVVGSSAEGSAVWWTEDGMTWHRAPLPGSAAFDPYLSVAAGPSGVVVVGYDRASPIPPHSSGVRRFSGYRIWHSSDGRIFDQGFSLQARDVVEASEVALTATSSGFLLSRNARPAELFFSEDGLRWATMGSGLPEAMIDAREASNGTTVALTTWFEFNSTEKPGLSAYYRTQGDTEWRTGAIDLGKLPDLGVVPRSQQWVHGAHEWGSGFIAFGTAGVEQRVGAVWTSPDGRAWTRMSVRENGFDKAPLIFAAVTMGTTTALLGMDTSIYGPNLTVWRTAEQ